MHELSPLRVLVISYTNHALDQFLEELLDIGIPERDMVRLGSKFTSRTYPLLLSKQSNQLRRSADSWAIINGLREHQSELGEELQSVFKNYANFVPSFDDILEYLEFSDDDRHFYDAFLIPSDDREWKRVGKKGKQVKPDYLFSRWKQGSDPGIFSKQVSTESERVWDLGVGLRHNYLAKWTEAITQDRVENIQELARQLDHNQERLSDLFNESKVENLRSRRIIGCTTTAAAMYTKLIRAANPDVVLVEEAGEILESHILTAMAPSVKQLVLIGDHKQLRPKVNNYALTVERGDGYDLNMSLFERMILQGFNHTTLRKQHRMHPEISLFPRALTYPDLRDGSTTGKRPAIIGLRDRVIFINHEHRETEISTISDRRDPGTKASKENYFESLMVLKLVRYLAQQGYGTDKMVVLTPYLGQLRLLRETLKEENDPILNDLDASSLLQAGLMTQAASMVGKRPLRLCTIGRLLG
jgi:AAA domain